MKIKDLKNLCIKFNIRTAKKNKSEIINHINELHQKHDENTVNNVLKDIENGELNYFPNHHEHYRSFFNGVDLHNRFWYKFYFGYHVKHWQTVYLFSIIKVAIINSWVIFNEIVPGKNLITFLEDLAEWLINPTF